MTEKKPPNDRPAGDGVPSAVEKAAARLARAARTPPAGSATDGEPARNAPDAGPPPDAAALRPGPAAAAGSPEIRQAAESAPSPDRHGRARMRDEKPAARADGADIAVSGRSGHRAREDEKPRRRGTFGPIWAGIRFLLVGSGKAKAAPKPERPAAGSRPGRLNRLRGGSLRRMFRRLSMPGRIAPSLPGRRRAAGSGDGARSRLSPDRKALRLAQERRATAESHISRSLDLSKRMGRTVDIDIERMREIGLVAPFGERTQIAEEFRLIKRPLLLNAFEKDENAIRNGNVIMVASSRSGEGKTFTAINLAMSIASERDLTVLLIDADVAKPDICNVLGVEADLGFVDVIADDRVDISDVILRTNIDNLSVMHAGRPHHLATELLASERMEQLVSELSRRYPERVVVMDSPPALLSSVAGVLALNVGQILFVVEAERTSQAAVDSALGLVSACKNINLLLNKTRPFGGSERFGSYNSSYY